MIICACGCGEEIEPLPHHKYRPPRYKADHFTRAGLTNKGKRTSGKRIPPNTLCACGCGQLVPETYPNGAPRYSSSPDGKFYIARGHRATCASKPRPRQAQRTSSDGHILLRLPEHRLAHKDGFVPEHRLIWEQVNGRPLKANEDVHHINGDPADNRPENLVALTKSKHMQLHKSDPAQRQSFEQLHNAGLKGAASRWHKAS